MTLEEMRQSKANLEYIVTTGQTELIVLDDIKNLIEYVDRAEKELDLDCVDKNYIPKEKIRKMIAEEITIRNELPESAIITRTMHEYTIATLKELLGDD